MATALDLGKTCADWPNLPTIGRPVANATVWLLDALLQAVPAGVPGQLYVGGVIPARGYFRLPEATAERFIPDPFSSVPGARLYRTGDLARLDGTGNLEFLGRADDQVKIRGFRVEPGEIEAALDNWQRSYKTPYSCVRPDRETTGRLCGPGRRCRTVRGRTAQRPEGPPPEYMIPGQFVALADMPLTPSGKLARRRLPDPDTYALAAETTHEPPQSDTEAAVISIWSELLGREHIGRQDDFFALGGHSLLVVRAISRLWEQFKVDLPLEALFENPIVADLAAYIDLASQDPEDDDWEDAEDDEAFLL